MINALIHSIVAAMCMTAGIYGADTGILRSDEIKRWLWCAAVLLVLALSLLLGGDLAWVAWWREIARDHDWYGLRRPLQVVVLLAAGVLGAYGYRWLSKGMHYAHPAWAVRCAVTGLLMLCATQGFRFVSFHYTDMAINWRVAGMSAGRWLDLLALALMALGAARKVIHTYTYRV